MRGHVSDPSLHLKGSVQSKLEGTAPSVLRKRLTTEATARFPPKRICYSESTSLSN